MSHQQKRQEVKTNSYLSYHDQQFVRTQISIVCTYSEDTFYGTDNNCGQTKKHTLGDCMGIGENACTTSHSIRSFNLLLFLLTMNFNINVKCCNFDVKEKYEFQKLSFSD